MSLPLDIVRALLNPHRQRLLTFKSSCFINICHPHFISHFHLVMLQSFPANSSSCSIPFKKSDNESLISFTFKSNDVFYQRFMMLFLYLNSAYLNKSTHNKIRNLYDMTQRQIRCRI